MIANEGGAITCKPNVPLSTDSPGPDDEKCCDKHGRFWSSLTSVGNTITIPVGKRVEAVCDVVVDYSSSPMIDAV